MAHSIISSAEKNFVYLSNKIETVAIQALILIAKTVSQVSFRVQFFFTENRNEKSTLINRVAKALDQTVIFTWTTREKHLKKLGLDLINDFYSMVSNQRSVFNAFKGTWEILKINLE